MAKDREMEIMEDNHRVEVRVYVQKVKHLEYEHKNTLGRITSEVCMQRRVTCCAFFFFFFFFFFSSSSRLPTCLLGLLWCVAQTKTSLFEETDTHTTQEQELRSAKRALRMELKENELVNAKEIKTMRQAQEKNLQKLKDEFDKQLQQLQVRVMMQRVFMVLGGYCPSMDSSMLPRCCCGRCGVFFSFFCLQEKHEKRVQLLKRSLELRRKVEIHEIEERKNLHINDLLRNHEDAFGEIKKYYNDITRDNLKIIRRLKSEVSEMTERAATNQQLMMKIAQENKQLSEPLKSAVQKVESLQNDLKDAEKDKMSLKNAKARLRVMQRTIAALEREHKQLEHKFDEVEAERDELYDNFEGTVRAVQRKSHLKNMVLEQRVEGMLDACEQKQEQLSQVLNAAELDPAVLSMVAQRLDQVLDGRNGQIKHLQYAVARVAKAHNDVLRVYSAKLAELGVPVDAEDFPALSQGAGAPGLATTSGPAGLVVMPTT